MTNKKAEKKDVIETDTNPLKQQPDIRKIDTDIPNPDKDSVDPVKDPPVADVDPVKDPPQ